MGIKYTYDFVKSKFEEKGYILLSNSYKNNASPLVYICPKHWDKGPLVCTFASFIKGSGCVYCGGRMRKTQKEYESELAVKKPGIILIDKYISLKTKARHKCIRCGYEWDCIPDNLIFNKNGCPNCSHRRRVTEEEVRERIDNIHDNTIIMLNGYIDTQSRANFQCLQCGHVWDAKVNNILNGKGCPICKSSKGEQKISQILRRNNIKFVKQYVYPGCKHIALLPFDFYLPQYNALIEYDGLQHFQPCRFGGMSLEEAQEKFLSLRVRDGIKNNYCAEYDIPLLRIPYYNFNKIEELITLFLNSIQRKESD